LTRITIPLKQYRDEYYERLTAIRRDGDWEGWIKFYLRGIYEISKQATTAAKLIMDLQAKHRILVNSLGKAASTAMRLLELLYQQPFVSVPVAEKKLELSAPAARKAINNLENIGILKEISGKRRDRLYLYESYMDIIREGTEL